MQPWQPAHVRPLFNNSPKVRNTFQASTCTAPRTRPHSQRAPASIGIDPNDTAIANATLAVLGPLLVVLPQPAYLLH
jgi:hypothetical protein